MASRTLDNDLDRMIGRVFDPDWYRTRYPDSAATGLDPLAHFLRHRTAERRDPNRFFDGAWYAEHYPDVAASGMDPLIHYLRAGAAELRNPHPRFDVAYYVGEHPEAADNPLAYHLRTGVARGYRTEHPIDIRDYLPSAQPPLALTHRVFVDAIVPVHRDPDTTRRCLTALLADRALPLARIIVVDDAVADSGVRTWLRALAADGLIHLIRNPRPIGLANSINLGIDAAEGHDVAVLRGDTVVPHGWSRRLAAQAWAHPRIATVSPFSNAAAGESARLAVSDHPAETIDAVCRTVNAGRFAVIPQADSGCIYIRRDALHQIGALYPSRADDTDPPMADFSRRATQAGWHHRVACDIFLCHADADEHDRSASQAAARPHPAASFRFAVTAAMFRVSKRPVILMISHDLGGGVRRHIDGLIQRCRPTARVFLLEGTDRGAALSVPSQPDHPVLRLPSDRIDDLVQVLKSANLSRVHIHHMLHIDMDVRRLIHRLGVPFDVTVHDYFAICPQVNLLRRPEGIYCGEPGPAGCNACIADLASHGARDILAWRAGKAWQFHDAERVICPSGDVARRLARYGVEDNVVVVPHEQPASDAPASGAPPSGLWPLRRPTGPVTPLRVALIGVLANHKGARTVAAVAEAAAPGALDIHLIGELEPSFPAPARALIHTTGKYRETELDELLQATGPHVVWFPSSAPETYSYTLDAAIAAGLPIVATRLGSLPERLAGRPDTWLVDPGAPTEVWLATFDAVAKSLRTRKPPRSSMPPPVNADFYSRRYLTGKPPTALPQTRTKPRIVVVAERLADGSLSPAAYIRLLLPLDHPAIAGGWQVVLADTETVFGQQGDVVVTQRAALPNVTTADRLAEHTRRIGATLLYDLDDDLPQASATGGSQQAAVVRRMLTVADSVWLSSARLAHRLRKIRPDVLDRATTVIENGLDERLWTAPDNAAPWWDEPVRILCMGAHARDFALVEPALVRLKAAYGDRIAIDILEMTGQRALPPGLNRLHPSSHAKRSYPALVHWLTAARPAWHIGLAPLLDVSANRAKPAIEGLEYAALGIATLASDVPAYRGSIAAGAGGQLVRNDHRAWYAALDWLIRDQSLRRSLGAGGRTAFEAQSTLIQQAPRRTTAWDTLLKNRAAAT